MPTTTSLAIYPLAFPTPTVRFLLTSWWTCITTGVHAWRNRSDSLLAPDHPISVISPTIRDNLNLDIYPVPGWKGRVPSWYGIPCRIGRVTLWLPFHENPGQLRSFSLLALLPQDDLTDCAPFIHLGAQFLIEHRIRVTINGDDPSRSQIVAS